MDFFPCAFFLTVLVDDVGEGDFPEDNDLEADGTNEIVKGALEAWRASVQAASEDRTDPRIIKNMFLKTDSVILMQKTNRFVTVL